MWQELENKSEAENVKASHLTWSTAGSLPRGQQHLFVVWKTLKDCVDMLLSCFPRLFIPTIMIPLTTWLSSTSLMLYEMYLKHSPGFCIAFSSSVSRTLSLTKVCEVQGMWHCGTHLDIMKKNENPIVDMATVSRSINLVLTAITLQLLVGMAWNSVQTFLVPTWIQGDYPWIPVMPHWG